MSEHRPVALITGSARRVGAEIARSLHAAGCNVALHYRSSQAAVQSLSEELQANRADSTLTLSADLGDVKSLQGLVDTAVSRLGRLDYLVHNASSFYPTPLSSASAEQFDELFASNVKGPFFLTQASATHLRASGGAVVSLLDIYAERPLPDHPLYSMAKAAHRMMVLSLAEAMGPEVRVNGVAPGTVLWSEQPFKAETPEAIATRTALKRVGSPQAVAAAVRFLLMEGDYCTGVILPVDGGRLLST